MKKPVKITFISLGTLVGLVIILVLTYMFRAKSELKTFAPLSTKQITEDVYSINDSFTNVFLVKSSNGYIAFDAGNNLETIKAELEKLNINPEEVKTLFLTHTDGDHVASIPLFENTEIYLSHEEQRLINGEASRFMIFGNKIECDNYKLVSDNQVFNLDSISIQCILTPGHTPGSTCYLVNNKYLFTGDCLSLINGKVNAFNNLFNMDTETQLKSIKKLSKLDSVQYIFTAHHGMTNNFNHAFSKD